MRRCKTHTFRVAWLFVLSGVVAQPPSDSTECTLSVGDHGALSPGEGFANITVYVENTGFGQAPKEVLAELWNVRPDGTVQNRRRATTTSAGCVQFWESMGTGSCNDVGVTLPALRGDYQKDFGCLYNDSVCHTFLIGPTGEDFFLCRVVDNSEGAPLYEVVDIAVYVDYRCEGYNCGGRIVPAGFGHLVRLEVADPEGNTIAVRAGQTNEQSCVTFLERVAPHPCKSFKASLPNEEYTREDEKDLGCLESGYTDTTLEYCEGINCYGQDTGAIIGGTIGGFFGFLLVVALVVLGVTGISNGCKWCRGKA